MDVQEQRRVGHMTDPVVQGWATGGSMVDGVDLQALATREGTPLHAYSAPRIRDSVQELQSALHGMDALIC
jgi:diaminopimelate decarboxylase